ncbi:MAG: hypothetical protein WBA44_09700 [Mesorhizobium sp.]
MIALISLKTASVLFADAARIAPTAQSARGQSGVDLGAANGARRPAQGASVVFENIYSVNYVDATKLKINLIERVGEAFGMNIDDFKNAGEMAGLIEKVLEQFEKDNGSIELSKEVRRIEKELGLDELGLSLDDMLGAMKEPGGREDKKVLAALGKEAGDFGQRRPALDDIGIYRI